MTDELIGYYETELRFIREMGSEFARSYPHQAKRLHLSEKGSADPHVERLIEAFALIAGRIHHKIDSEFPEIVQSLMGLLYPHYLRPIPSIALAELSLDQGQSLAKLDIARGSIVKTKPIPDIAERCYFRTCYPVTLWPLRVTSASLLTPGLFPSGVSSEGAVAGIRIRMQWQGGARFASTGLDGLCFCIDADETIAYTLFELIANNTFRVVVSDPAGARHTSVTLGASALRPMGYRSDETLLPYPERSFVGYRLLQEYFAFPRKYLFFEIGGLKEQRSTLGTFGERFDLVFLLKSFEGRDRLGPLAQAIKAETFRLGCTPVINLFQKPAEPIGLTHRQSEYQVVPDVKRPHAMEVYSVDLVKSTGGYVGQAREYAPFYSLRHTFEGEASAGYWYETRRRSVRKDDPGTDVFLSLVDLSFDSSHPTDEALSVATTCTNRDYPAQLEITYGAGEIEVDRQPKVQARFLSAPTKPLRPPLGGGLQWRLISHLALNQLSLSGGQSGADPMREILRLYNYSEDPALQRLINGIVRVKSNPHLAPVSSAEAEGIFFALGTKVDIEFDETQYPAGGAFLLASVLDRFLGLYSAVNSFSQLVARTSQRKEVLRQWNPRTGEQIIL